MAEKEQVKALAPTRNRIYVDDDEAISMELKDYHRDQKCINCCGCFAAILLILAVTILVLIFTVFYIKDPKMKINSMKIEGLDRVNMTNLRSDENLTVLAEVSVKNPNSLLRRSNHRCGYDSPGLARARRTIRINVTLEVIVENILEAVPKIGIALSSGALPVRSYTSISGRVQILEIFKKNVVMKMNCTMIVNLISQEVQDQNCKRRISH
ncbi:unnamed protein product [Ilex paraguariensis]|uniref:Late embryogenesis abundant protein LEA-2 subgroup domain-containing protein n=1 Tax=Ilex paraguariensis TaxID=185542 RepID=A0ABC8SI27_9AQUA